MQRFPTPFRTAVITLAAALSLPAGAADLPGKAAPVTRKVSPLPFDPAGFATQCIQHIPMRRGVPQATQKCAPAYFPYVADAKNADVLARSIGQHDYAKGGRDHAQDYAPPFASGLHPVFLVLPPLQDVQLVRVEDLEGGDEQRDTMSGVYLAIRNGKVTAQLNEGCTIDATYTCVDEDGNQLYRLQASGQFRKLR